MTHRRSPQPLGLACAVLSGALLACYGAEGERQRGGQEPGVVVAVEAVAARSGALPQEERLSGVVRARNQVVIRPEITAPIVEVLVESGQAVERGQVLIVLDDSTLRDQLRQAEASARLARAAAEEARARVLELEARVVRTRVLAEQEVVSTLELETREAQLLAIRAAAAQAKARVEQAEATVEERRTALGRTRVRAPAGGHVGERRAEVGMLADPGTPLFVLGDLAELIVEVPLTEAMLGYLRQGQPARISAPTQRGEPILATLSRISPFLRGASFSTVGEIELGNRDRLLYPGMFVVVDVLYGESERATLVPTSALWDDPRSGLVGVFVVDFESEPATAGGLALSDRPLPVALRRVEVLAEGRTTVGLRGVEPGEWVVTIGQQLLGDRGATSARVRPTSWEQVLELQELQREDLLRFFLEEQRRIAASRGAGIPSSEEYLGGGGNGAPPPKPQP